MDTASCPECGTELTFGSITEQGEIIQCPDCGVDLEVMSLDPIELALAPEEAEDWGE
jgi:alpha-aminoadipate carrier protein LysW